MMYYYLNDFQENWPVGYYITLVSPETKNENNITNKYWLKRNKMITFSLYNFEKNVSVSFNMTSDLKHTDM